jgi:hypothetical protein
MAVTHERRPGVVNQEVLPLSPTVLREPARAPSHRGGEGNGEWGRTEFCEGIPGQPLCPALRLMGKAQLSQGGT